MKKLKVSCHIILLFSFALSGCATTSFQTGKPIKVEGATFTRRYTQDDKGLAFDDMINEFKKHGTTKTKASQAEIWYYSTLVVAGVGGYLIGYNLGSSSDSKQSGILAGLGLIGLSFVPAYYTDKNMVDAVETYNKDVSKTKSARVTWTLSY